MRRLAPLLCCLALAWPVQSAWAGLFDDEEARKRVVELRKELQQTVDALGKRVDAATQNQLDFANQAEALRADVARLTGQVEVLTNSLEAAHKRQQDFYVDLDNRLRKLEGGTGASPDAGGAVKPVEAKSDPQAEMRDYEAALGHFRASKFKEAQTAFEAFIATHAKSSLLPNAHYWLGSSLYQQKQFVKAADSFGLVASTWPTDGKAPDALLAQANALLEAKDTKAAVKVLEVLVEKYPTSTAVVTARARLKTLAPPKKR